MAKLTLSALSSAKPGATLPDPAVEGLRYRIRASGKVFAELRYKIGPGKWQSVPLGRVSIDDRLDDLSAGRHPSVDRPFQAQLSDILAPVREAAQEMRRKVRSGHDPRGGASLDSLKALIDRYLENAVTSLRPRTQAESRRHLLKHWAPLHDRPAAALTKGEIADHLLRLKVENGPVAALRSRATLRAMFAWAFDADLIDAMPPFPSKRVLAIKEQSRERVLTLEELRAIWAEAGEGDHGVIVRLLMLTGQRREEVGGMRWSELGDLDRALWSLPGERTKNGRPHVVPLSTQAVELLRTVELRPGRDNVFGNGNGAYSGWSRSKRRLDGRIARQRAEQRLGRELAKDEKPAASDHLSGWTLHDLRRSWSTHVNKLIQAPHVVEVALNHAGGIMGSVAGIYNREQYLSERTRAMQLWADHLLQGEPAKVVQLRA